MIFPGIPHDQFALFEGWREISMQTDFGWHRIKERLKEVPGLWTMLGMSVIYIRL